ncbi:hypothetical protein BJX68DRAFT_249000 [Aspergillus pseudodeflectus]|uniref:DUF7137 domain-containing protein n=1 Tax=Aspergillus pseudodeflectus TaxID=176178 RepID=A0ABR4JEF3_9EURO
MRFTYLFPLACLLLLAVLSRAWQLEEMHMGSHGQLLPRQDDSESDSETTTTDADSATTGATPTADETASETETSTSTRSSSDDDNESQTTSRPSVTSTRGSNSTHTSSSNRTTSVDPRSPPGGISILTPAATSTTYYKVGDTLTFVWNYTSLEITPTAVNVIASCSINSATYTISSNMSVSETQSVEWDTGKYQANATIPLLTATYTLIVYDESKDVDDIASAGELSSQNRYYFGMYISQPYVDLDEYVCATCSGALSSTETQALKFGVGMALITIATFTWFATGFGAFAT